MTIEIRNNTGEPWIVSHNKASSNHVADEVTELQHGEVLILDGYDPDRGRFTMRPSRNPHLPRDYRAQVRSDADMKPRD